LEGSSRAMMAAIAYGVFDSTLQAQCFQELRRFVVVRIYYAKYLIHGIVHIRIPPILILAEIESQCRYGLIIVMMCLLDSSVVATQFRARTHIVISNQEGIPMSTAQTKSSKSYATAAFNTRDQNAENIQSVVSQILGRGGCPRCGLVAFLSVEFQGDPPPDMLKQHVASYTEYGLNAA
jgi:hypothetical protein